MPTPNAVPFATQLCLLKDVPLNQSYEHTYYFNSVAEQTAFFDKKEFYKEYPASYNRQNQNFRIHGKADDYFSCNYIRFQNILHGTKWYYGFVDEVIYISDQVTEIRWTMDYIQSYWFEFTFPQQYVIRCHSVTDEIGENTVPEPFQTGEMKVSEYTQGGYADTRVVVGVVDVPNDPDEDDTIGRLYSGVYSGLDLYTYEAGSSALKNLLLKYKRRSNAVTMMYSCPTKIIQYKEGHLIKEAQPIPDEMSFPKPFFGKPIDNYIPRNAKLYTYPFYYLTINNNSGDCLNLRYEFFTGDNALIKIYSTYFQPVQCKAMPWNYKNSQGLYHEEYLVLGDYPPISWADDSYANWLANNQYGQLKKVATGLFNTVVGVARASQAEIPGQAVAGVQQSFNGLSQLYDAATLDRVASQQADHMRGNMQSGGANFMNKQNDFYFTNMTLTKENARIIDSFFTRYGYAQNRLMNLNFTARPCYTYIKTANAQVNGTGSNPAKATIQNALNRGITFWRGDYLGDFTIDNSVTHEAHPDFYLCLVNDGSGAGEYMAGTTVTIRANDPPTGKRFDHWEITFGNIPLPNAPTTTFVMPAGNTVCSAIFVDKDPDPPQPGEWNLAKQLRLHEGEVEYSDWIKEAITWCMGGFMEVAWCAIAVAYCAYQCDCLDQFGVPDLGSKRELASSTAMKNRFAARGKLHRGYGWDKSYQPKQGDILFISWSSNPSDLDHTAICWGFSTEGVAQITYIGGNQGMGSTDGVTMRTTQNDNKIVCWVGEMDNTFIKKPVT